MKVLALYLPQYHEIPENNLWWGKGYTEWNAVRGAQKYFKGHRQPRVPLNNNYYDLSRKDANTWKWQSDLANKYGVYGFAIYHYWFQTGKQLLEKPMEILLAHPEITINYCICWANETWTRNWYGVQKEVLMKQKYGDETEWINHFNYLLQFFKDPRYIKIDNRPMVNIYHTTEIEDLEAMESCWNRLARSNGFAGIYFVSGNTGANIDSRKQLFDAYYNFEPSYSLIHRTNKLERFIYDATVLSRSMINKVSAHKIVERPIDGKKFTKRLIRTDAVNDVKIFPGCFPQWDNTPRRLYKGTVFKGMDPSNFQNQVKVLLRKYKDPDFLYVNAWNEWGEGAYLEPDDSYGYDFLNVIKCVNDSM